MQCARIVVQFLAGTVHWADGKERTPLRAGVGIRAAHPVKATWPDIPRARFSRRARHGWAPSPERACALYYLSDCKNFGLRIIYV